MSKEVGYANRDLSRDFITIIGIFSGFFLVVFAIYRGGGFEVFFDLNALMITVGGTIAATCISFPPHQVLKVFRVFIKIFGKRIRSLEEIVEAIVLLSIKARQGGNLGLGKEEEKIGDQFLRQGISMVVDGLDVEVIDSLLSSEMVARKARHQAGQQIFFAMSNYAPAFGLVGTIIGLVQMLSKLSDPSSLGPSMAVALITTFYGAIMANLIFLPITEKLKTRMNEELLLMSVIKEGIISLRQNEATRVIENKLNTYLPVENRIKVNIKSSIDNDLKSL